MAEEVQSPQPSGNSGNGMGMMIPLVVLVLLGIAFFIYGLPALKNMGGTQINVPDTIDVNINQPAEPTQ